MLSDSADHHSVVFVFNKTSEISLTNCSYSSSTVKYCWGRLHTEDRPTIVIGQPTNRWRKLGCQLPRQSNGLAAPASRVTAGGDVTRTAARSRRVNCTVSRCRQRRPIPSTFHLCGYFRRRTGQYACYHRVRL